MKQFKLQEHLSTKDLKQRMGEAESLKEYKRWQCLYMVSSYEVDAAFISDVTGISVHTIYKLISLYNAHGPDGITLTGAGGRRRSLLSMEEEEKMMEELSKKASEGLILHAKDIKREVEKRVGQSVSEDYLWDLLGRHKWVKQSPRPEHPQKDKAAQQKFKKNSKKIWKPHAAGL